MPSSSTRRPETYEPTNLCRKINIFGISISKPRSRSRSRPRSPRLSIDIPPPPGFDEDSQPQPPYKPSSRPASPALAPATARGVLATTPSLSSLTLHDSHNRAKEFNGDPHPGSAMLRGFFSCKSILLHATCLGITILFIQARILLSHKTIVLRPYSFQPQ